MPEPKKPEIHTPTLPVTFGSAGVVDGVQVGAEELAEMDVQLLGDDVLVELLPDGLAVGLVGLDDAVDGAVDLLGEEVLDQHAYAP